MKRKYRQKLKSENIKKNDEDKVVSKGQGGGTKSGNILQLVEVGSESEVHGEVAGEETDVTQIEEAVKQVEESAFEQVEKAAVEQEKEAAIEQEEESAVEFVGEPFDPSEIFCVLALVDVSAKVKKMRKIPAFHHLAKPVTRIGNGKRTDFKVDDFESVRREHGAIVFKDGTFSAFPQDGMVIVDGKGVSEKGMILENGSQVEMGSARFLFLMVSRKAI